MTFNSLPGGTIIERGLGDISTGTTTNEALLVRIGGPRLRALGFDVPFDGPADPEIELYRRLAEREGDSAHSRYNALIRLLVSFERALESATP